MKLYMDPVNLNYFEALASKTRLRVVQLLSEKDMNIKELSEQLGISSSIMTKHIRKLESAKIITTRQVNKDGSRHKLCILLNPVTEIHVPHFRIDRSDDRKKMYETNLPVGQYTMLKARPPCGLASEETTLGDMDDPVHMLSPERVAAQLLWLGEGYVEYVLPNYLREGEKLTDIEIQGEFGSEAAGYNDNWPSQIHVLLNEIEICVFSTPGDIGSMRGSLTPQWWGNNQYGILVIIRVTEKGVLVNGELKSDVGISQFDAHCDKWVVRFLVEDQSKGGGGLTLFGEKFGNYSQNIRFLEFYE